MLRAPASGVDPIYREVFERGLRYCLPHVSLTRQALGVAPAATLTVRAVEDDEIEATFLGASYRLRAFNRRMSASEVRLVESVGHVLSARYRSLNEAGETGVDLFRGVPEDRFVSAFLDSRPYDAGLPPRVDRVADALDVLRVTSSSTYENRRINTGVLLVGDGDDPCHTAPPQPEGALPYSVALTTTRTFHRLSDGMRTVALVDGDGCMVELVDIAEWAEPFRGLPLPAPCAARFEAHCRATLRGGHLCLVLTPNGEMKAFAGGVQVFSFLNGAWRLSDMAEKYLAWQEAVGHGALGERLFTTALNLAERRRGGLFVVLRDAASAEHLVAMADRLDAHHVSRVGSRSKDQFQYLLRDTSVLELTPTVLESIARIDGAIVVSDDARLLAFGAILRLHFDPSQDLYVAEGGRTTAAMVASRYGHALKVSEDGIVTFYSAGQPVWEL